MTERADGLIGNLTEIKEETSRLHREEMRNIKRENNKDAESIRYKYIIPRGIEMRMGGGTCDDPMPEEWDGTLKDLKRYIAYAIRQGADNVGLTEDYDGCWALQRRHEEYDPMISGGWYMDVWNMPTTMETELEKRQREYHEHPSNPSSCQEHAKHNETLRCPCGT